MYEVPGWELRGQVGREKSPWFPNWDALAMREAIHQRQTEVDLKAQVSK